MTVASSSATMVVAMMAVMMMEMKNENLSIWN